MLLQNGMPVASDQPAHQALEKMFEQCHNENNYSPPTGLHSEENFKEDHQNSFCKVSTKLP